MQTGIPDVRGTAQELFNNVCQFVQEMKSSLELPSFSEYGSSYQAAALDVVAASKSVSYAAYMTFRPIILFLAFLSGKLWIVFRFLAIQLFGQLHISLKHGYRQLKVGAVMFVSWQRSLSRAALGLEICALGLITLCFLLRRWIIQNRYVERTTQWYKGRKRAVRKKYNRLVRRISHTSLFLAMLLPHAIFLTGAVCFKFLLPQVVTWLVTETPATSALSLWYPFVATSSLLRKCRAQQRQITNNEADAPPRQSQRSGTGTGLYPRTTPRNGTAQSLQEQDRPSAAQRHWRRARAAFQNANDFDLVECAEYWLQYWVVYSLVSSTSHVLVLIPIVGRILSRLSAVAGILPQLEFLFYLWINVVPLMVSGDSAANALERENRPLQLLYQRIAPLAEALVNSISHAIPAPLWERAVSTTGSVLGVFVMLKIFSSDTRDRILHIVENSAPFLPPGITLFMPSFITAFGVVYCKSVVPSARSIHALESSANRNNNDAVVSVLEYWVLHCVLAWFLRRLSGILWWIPFSTHATLCVWCLLQMPQTTAAWYDKWEEELISFGLMARHDGSSDVEVEKTITAKFVRYLLTKLPSASAQDGIEQNGVSGVNLTEGKGGDGNEGQQACVH